MTGAAKTEVEGIEADVVPLDPVNDDDVIRELAAMTELEYERQRATAAEALNVRTTVLDRLVNAERKAANSDEAEPFSDMEPWPEPINGDELVSKITRTIRRFCVLPENAEIIMAFWILHAHAHDAADISPILALTSPEKRCGKSTALSVISALVPKPMHAVNMTPAVIFRVVEKFRPTVLIDEGDTFLADNDELRGILNGGHNRLTANVWRTVGDDHEPRSFRVWAPKCIAMIGRLPDTLEDRALNIPLRRRQVNEKVERFRADRVDEFVPIARQAARWIEDNFASLKDVEPTLPEDLTDRAQDNARALVAIAERIGGEWPAVLRAALVEFAKLEGDDARTPGVMLLRDISEIISSRRGGEIRGQDLLDELAKLEDSPWAEWRRGEPISGQGVAKLLRPFGIKPRRTKAYRFYETTDFEDAFARYLPDPPSQPSPSVTRSQAADKEQQKGDASGDAYNSVTVTTVTRAQPSPQPSPKNEVFPDGYEKVTLGDGYTGGAEESAWEDGL